MPEEIESQPGEIIEEQPRVSCLSKIKIHKFKILGGLLGVLVFTGAVFGAYKFGQRQIQPAPQPTPTPEVVITPTPEPTVAEVSQPSPTPITIEKIPYKPISSWQTYTDSQAKFSVQYPPNYKIGASFLGREVYFWSCVNDPKRGEVCLSGYTVRIFDDYDGGSRRAWAEKKFGGIANPYYEDVLVAGINALIVMESDPGSVSESWVLMPKANKMYVFGFPFGWNHETGEKPDFDFIKQVLSTFRFLE